MQRVLEQIEAHYEESIISGNGITVAVLDTGVEKHPDLAGKIIGFKDFVNKKMFMYDDNGHGTHVCGIICGNGALSGGIYRGIAPGADLVVCKVLNEKGNGCTEHMLDALHWVLQNKDKHKIRILNISVGIGDLKDKEKESLLRKRMEEVWDSGITVICAAGNKGPENDTISSVGGSKKVITVGCHDGRYCLNYPRKCSDYSGRGVANSPLRKPDIVAPGTDIVSCNNLYQKHHGRIFPAYIKKSGTSMATPIVSGAAALTFSKYPEISNEEFKQKLTLSATDLGEAWNVQGWGMVNVKQLLSLK